MKLAAGKIQSTTGAKGEILEQILFEASADTTVEYMLFNNTSEDLVVLNLFIQFEDVEIMFRQNNYQLNSGILEIDKKIYLKEFEKIIVKVSQANVVHYLINGYL